MQGEAQSYLMYDKSSIAYINREVAHKSAPLAPQPPLKTKRKNR